MRASPIPPITIIIGSLEVGGAEMHLSQIVPALKKRDFDIEILSLSPKVPLKPIFEKAGCSVLYPSSAALVPKMFSFFQRGINLFARFFFLLRHLRKRRHHILHFFLPEAYVLGMVAALLTRHHSRRIMSRRSLNTYQNRYPLLKFLERKLHPFCHGFLCNAQAIKAQLVEEGISPDKITVIYNGLEKSRIPSLPLPQTHQKDQPFIFVCVANLIPYKGHKDLIAALALIKDKLPPWKLWLIGQDRGIKSMLLEDIAHAGLHGHIEFIHNCTNPLPYLEKSSVGVLASHEEGFPNAILEMMAAKLPVVATNVGGNPEAVQDGLTGFIVPPKSPQDLAKALLSLAQNENLRNRLGERGAERFNAYFTLDVCAREYKDFYETTLSTLRSFKKRKK